MEPLLSAIQPKQLPWRPFANSASTAFLLIVLALGTRSAALFAQDAVAANSAPAASTETPSFVLIDENEKRAIISLDDLQKLPRIERTVTDHGETVKYEGVALAELLKHYGVTFGETLRGPRVDLVVLIKAGDKYRTSFALAEIDPDNTDKVVLLADRNNGQHLAAREAPVRIVVPDEKRHVRWIRNVQEVHIVHPVDYLGE